MPTVSIIMNCHNGEKYLREAIDSIYAQTFKDWEIIFWDNLSTDKSHEIAKGYDSRLRYFRGTEFLPLGTARNKAVDKAEGDFIAFLDTDDIWMPEHLSRLMSAFDRDTIVVYSNFTIKDMTTGRDYIPFNPRREFHSGDITRFLCKKNFIWLQAMAVRASAVKKLDYAFDPEFLTAEDFEFILRLSQAGKFNYIPEPTLIYRMHGSSLTASKRHYFAHDFSCILEKYKDTLDRRMFRDLARQYMLTVRLDLNAVGFRVMPFLRLGFSLRQIIISLLFILFPGKNIWELKEKLMKPLNILSSIVSRQEKVK